MKIYGNNEPVSRIHDVQGRTQIPKSVENKQEMNTRSVDISNLASEMASLQGAMKSSPDIRTEKVNPIKAEIDKGTYKVDDDKLIEALYPFFQ